MKKVSRVQVRFEHLVRILKKVRQPSVKGLSFTVSEGPGKVFIFFHYGKDTDVYRILVRKSGRKIVCETGVQYGWEPKDYVMVGKVFKLVGKFYKICKEFA